jgi:hypothetical protein
MNATHTNPREPPSAILIPRKRSVARRARSSEKRCRLNFHPLLIGFILLALLIPLQLGREKPQSAAPETGRLAAFGEMAKTDAPLNIIGLQSLRKASSIQIRSSGGREGTATLVNLNPTINAWYLLEIAWADTASKLAFHLENVRPRTQSLALDESYPFGIVFVEEAKQSRCDLFGGDSAGGLEEARRSQLPYASLCGGRVYLRNPARGNRTTTEAATKFLRDQGWGGEEVIVLFHHILEDRNRETGEIRSSAHSEADAPRDTDPVRVPLAAAIDPKFAGQTGASHNMEITPENLVGNGLRPGEWYPVRGNPGIYVSLIQPNMIAPEVLQKNKGRVNSLDSVEVSALCYLVAFDLEQFDLAYSLGTDHPAVTWSNHMLSQERDPDLPGPDGIGNIAPLVATGVVRPDQAPATVAVFTGGFKRDHGAFKSGELALKNHGSHYGFAENGVVFSKLQPGLATIYVHADGYVGMKTWDEADDNRMPAIRYARQNGVPLLEFDEATQSGVPGRLVTEWGAGNWSGSEDAKLRTMRSGVGIQQNGAKRYLIYAVFSTATPSAMVRVFQAYRCNYAMLLDMNALEHTYLALYQRSGSQLIVNHLLSGMGEVDKSGPSGPIPRFLAYPDNRDFFYMVRRSN